MIFILSNVSLDHKKRMRNEGCSTFKHFRMKYPKKCNTISGDSEYIIFIKLLKKKRYLLDSNVNLSLDKIGMNIILYGIYALMNAYL